MEDVDRVLVVFGLQLPGLVAVEDLESIRLTETDHGCRI